MHDPALRRASGFTLIEIMAVVIIIGLLMGIVGVAVTSQLDRARVGTTQTQIRTLESALALYQMDNGRFPTTEQGLQALVTKPTVGPSTRNYRDGGYLQRQEVPKDAWGNPFHYEAPGVHNPHSFDLWSLGADDAAGGKGNDADLGNWTEGAGTG